VPRTLVRRGPARVLLLAALVLTISPSAASAFSKAIWGEVSHNGVNQFPIYKQLGVSIYEGALSWNEVAPTRPRNPTNPRDPAYHWPAVVQQAIDQGKRFHIRVMLQLIGTPSWANGGHGWNWVPRNPGDFGAFATAASRRYKAVHLWMVWGEPSREANFQPFYPASNPFAKLTKQQQIAPHNYARLLDAGYGGLKRVTKQNLVIGGSTYTTGDIHTQQWIENMRLPNGRPPRMDMYAHNAFTNVDPTFNAAPSGEGAVEFPDLPRLAGWVDRYLHRGLRLFISEFTVPTCPDQEFNFYVDPKFAAKWVTDALRLSRHWNRIYALGWIHVYDEPPISCGGLLTTSGKHKSTFSAFAH
jgi:hypothetical protein